MCGIVGYTGRRTCREFLLDSLEKLEYRGYDSAGIALGHGDRIATVRAVGNLARLRGAVAEATGVAGPVAAAADGATGIGHTRWATHGAVSERNAHPHADPFGRVHIVLNGIIENHIELRQMLGASAFASETDAEVMAHLIERHFDGELAEAVRRASAEIEGHFALVAMSPEEPGVLVATRHECPLVIGSGPDGQIVASSVNVMVGHADRVIALEDGDVATVSADTLRIVTSDGEPAIRPVTALHAETNAVSKGSYETFMLKEIHEQPEAIAATLAGRLRDGRVELPELDAVLAVAGQLRRIVVVGCGTSYHAGLVGRYAIERWAQLPVDIDVASELRYRDARPGSGDLVIGLTQSGETADTLAALRQARADGATVLAITNVADSQVTREVDAVLLTRAGTEIGVAATKSYVVQLVAMYLIGLALARARGTLERPRIAELTDELEALPRLVQRAIVESDAPIAEFADRWADAPFFLYLGRHVGVPVAMEGALKLKEVSYVPAEAYAAGEMKHGPIALLDTATPVVCVATDSPVLTKLLANMSEVRAREATVLAVATEGSKHAAEHSDDVVYVPSSDWLLQPVLAAVPLQLLAYQVACRRGANVDQPRNLAKTVTVE